MFIDGDRFRSESPEAVYEGVFNINVEAEPHEIDIEFVAGPEAGNWNYGIFRVEGDELELEVTEVDPENRRIVLNTLRVPKLEEGAVIRTAEQRAQEAAAAEAAAAPAVSAAEAEAPAAGETAQGEQPPA